MLLTLARHRAVVWVAAIFLGPVVAAWLTLARPQLHENHVTLILVLPSLWFLRLGYVPLAWSPLYDWPCLRLLLDRALLQLQHPPHPRHPDVLCWSWSAVPSSSSAGGLAVSVPLPFAGSTT